MSNKAVCRVLRLNACKDCRYFIRSSKQCSRGKDNCILQAEDLSADRPSCEKCYWWNKKGQYCVRDPAGCAFELGLPSEKADLSINNDEPISCDSCPYGRGRPCVGYCMKQVIQDWKKLRKLIRGGGGMT